MQPDQKTTRIAFFDELEKAEKEISRLKSSIKKISQKPASDKGIEALTIVKRRLSATTNIINIIHK